MLHRSSVTEIRKRVSYILILIPLWEWVNLPVTGFSPRG
jgi:hypothetical protein